MSDAFFGAAVGALLACGLCVGVLVWIVKRTAAQEVAESKKRTAALTADAARLRAYTAMLHDIARDNDARARRHDDRPVS
jgi:hypothetical protein